MAVPQVEGADFLSKSMEYDRGAMNAYGGQRQINERPDPTVGGGISAGMGGAMAGAAVGAEVGMIGGPMGAAGGAVLGIAAYYLS